MCALEQQNSQHQEAAEDEMNKMVYKLV